MEDDNKLTQKFGPDVLADFLTNNKLQLLVRGMQCAQNGYLFFPSENLLTIFSAANWCGDFGNDAAVLHVQTQTEERGVRLQIRVGCLSVRVTSPSDILHQARGLFFVNAHRFRVKHEEATVTHVIECNLICVSLCDEMWLIGGLLV